MKRKKADERRGYRTSPSELSLSEEERPHEPHIKKLKIHCDESPIHLLPVELLVKIFSHSTTRHAEDNGTKEVCLFVCKLWSEIITLHLGPALRGKRLCSALASSGSIGLLNWARGKGFPWDAVDVVGRAASSGHLYLLKWLHDKHNLYIGARVSLNAARKGHLHILKWVRKIDSPLPDTICALAAGESLWERQMRMKKGPDDSTLNKIRQPRRGHLEVLKWAVEEAGLPMTNETCSNAAGSGDLEILQWARAHGCPWDSMICEDTCYRAAREGHLHILQWLREQGCPWDSSACTAAAKGRNLTVLRWLREQGCPWDESVCAKAAQAGSLEILQWARESGCPWDSATCSSAARKGRLHVLQWARERGCPWDSMTLSNARMGNHAHVIRWAEENGCPTPESMYYF